MEEHMLEAHGNIWDLAKPGDAVVITTNGFVKHNGELVMGRGIAAEARDLYPYLAHTLGALVTKHGNHVYQVSYINEPNIFSFPVKPARGPNGEPGWSMPADPDLIVRSLHELVSMIDQTNIVRVWMPRPGCGNGKLRWDDIRPLVARLDDRFTVVTV
jgi:hypothetical protein